ncbi:MAG: amidohydrolase family protein [Methyloligellaceae bacterium]
MRRTLIKNATIVTMDPDLGILKNADLLFEGEKIAEVSQQITADDAEIVDASGNIVIPGLVNAHQHTWQTGIRGIAGDWTMFDYLRTMHANLATQFRPDDIYIGNLVGALNQIDGGVTTLLDWCHNNPTPDHTDRAIDGLEESGIRALFCHGTPKPDPKDGGPHFSEIPQPASEIERLHKGRFSSQEQRVTLGMAILGPWYGLYDVAVQDIKLAQAHDLFVTAHMGLAFPRLAPDGVYRLAKDGLLSSKYNAVHCNTMTDEELKILADHGCSISATPEVEIQMGFGYPVAGRYQKLGGLSTIGVDVECNISGDMFQIMRFTLQCHRLLENAPKVEAGEAVDELSLKGLDALRWATIDGARAMGLDDKIGTLTPGKQADITIINGKSLNLIPVHDVVETLVFQTFAHNVDYVFIAGDCMKKEGKLLFDGLDGKIHELEQSGARILRDSGLERFANHEIT